MAGGDCLFVTIVGSSGGRLDLAWPLARFAVEDDGDHHDFDRMLALLRGCLPGE